MAVAEGDLPPAPAEDQLAQGLLEADWLAYRLTALERDLPIRLGGRAGELGKRIRAAVRGLFPELTEVVGE